MLSSAEGGEEFAQRPVEERAVTRLLGTLLQDFEPVEHDDERAPSSQFERGRDEVGLRIGLRLAERLVRPL